MKKVLKVIVVFLICIIIVFINSNVYATTITLEQIVEIFNKKVDEKFAGIHNTTSDASTVPSNQIGGLFNENVEDIFDIASIATLVASYDNDSINFVTSNEGKTESIEFLFKDNIIYIESNPKDENILINMFIITNLIDSIGEAYGYEEGDLAQTISAEESRNYTIEKEGFEIEEISETKIKMMIDISKKVPLIDFSDTYIEVDDLKDSESSISGDGSIEKSKGNVWFKKSGYDGEYTLLISERKQLTENSYKSILSILEVMFDNDKVIENFKSNFPNIYSGDKEFSGFSIKINPTDKTQSENFLVSENEFIRIVINKSLAINSTTEAEIDSNQNDFISQREKLLDIDTLPRTGEDNDILLFILYIVVGICSIGLITLLLMKRKKI